MLSAAGLALLIFEYVVSIITGFMAQDTDFELSANPWNVYAVEVHRLHVPHCSSQSKGVLRSHILASK